MGLPKRLGTLIPERQTQILFWHEIKVTIDWTRAPGSVFTYVYLEQYLVYLQRCILTSSTLNHHPFLVSIDYGPHHEIAIDVVVEKTAAVRINVIDDPYTMVGTMWTADLVPRQAALHVLAQAIEACGRPTTTSSVTNNIESPTLNVRADLPFKNATSLSHGKSFIKGFKHGDTVLQVRALDMPNRPGYKILRDAFVWLRLYLLTGGTYAAFESVVRVVPFFAMAIEIRLYNDPTEDSASLTSSTNAGGSQKFNDSIQTSRR